MVARVCVLHFAFYVLRALAHCLIYAAVCGDLARLKSRYSERRNQSESSQKRIEMCNDSTLTKICSIVQMAVDQTQGYKRVPDCRSHGSIRPCDHD